MRKEIRICGFGGQGIILAGVILGEAATRAGFMAVQTQSYGPESRGGAARSEVVISSEPDSLSYHHQRASRDAEDIDRGRARPRGCSG